MARIVAILLAACAAIAALWWVLFDSPAEQPTPSQDRTDERVEAIAEQPAEQEPQAEAVLDAEPDATADRVAEPTIPEPPEEGFKRLEVVAVDADGNTVEGVPVAIGMVIPFERRAIRLASAHTDAQGRAYLDIDPQRWRRDAPLLANPELMIDAKIPHPDRVRVKRSYEDALASETQLKVPALSWVELRAVHADGSTIEFPLGFSYTWAPAEQADDDDAWSRYTSVESDGESGRFLIGTNMSLRLSAWDQEHRYVTGYLNADGPTETLIEAQQHVIALGPLHPVFRAQMILPSGEPARNTRFMQYQRLTRLATEEYPQGEAETRWNANHETDAEGWVELPFATNDYFKRFDREWIWVHYPKDSSQRRPELDDEGTIQASTYIGRDVADGEVLDFGELQLEEVRYPLIAAGNVHDEFGEAIAIDVWAYPVDSEGKTGRQTIWRGKSDRQGNFEIRTEVPESGLVELSIGGRGWTGNHQRVQVGSENIDVQLVPSIDLYGSVILDDGLPWMEIEVRMPPGRAKRLGLGGSFKVDHVRRASDAYVWFEHNDIELWRSSTFVVEGQGDIRPDAVQKQDLRGTMRAWTTTFVDQDGEYIAEDTDIYFRTPTQLKSSAEVQRLGYWTQITKSDVHSIEIGARGYEIQTFAWPLPDQIVLRKSFR